MPKKSVRFASVQDLKALLNIAAGDTSRDEVLGGLIESTSAELEALLLASDQATLKEHERKATFESEEGDVTDPLFLRPFPGEFFKKWGMRPSEGLETIDLKTLQFVVDQVQGFRKKLKDNEYDKKLVATCQSWWAKCNSKMKLCPPDTRFDLIYILKPFSSSYVLSPEWGFELRLCWEGPSFSTRLEGILFSPRQGSVRTRVDILFPNLGLQRGPRKLLRIIRKELLHYAVPTIFFDVPRTRDDFLADLIVQVLRYLGAYQDPTKQPPTEFFEHMDKYLRKFFPKNCLLSKPREEQKSIMSGLGFENFTHLCRKYGLIGSGKVWRKYVKLVVSGKVKDYLRSEDSHLEIADSDLIEREEASPGVSTQHPSSSVSFLHDQLTVNETAKLLGISRDQIYQRIRHKEICVEKGSGGKILLAPEVVQELRNNLDSRDRLKTRVQDIAAERSINPKSVMRRLQRAKKKEISRDPKSGQNKN